MADRRFLFGAEASYGNTATTWRRMEIATDDHKTNRSELSFRGIGAQGGAQSLASYRTVAKGATGTIQVPAYSNGLGLLNRAAGTSFTSTAVPDTTGAFEQVTTFGTDGPPADRSISTVAYRDRANGTVDSYLYRGGIPTQVEGSVDIDGHLMLTYTIDYRTGERENPTPNRSPVVVDPDVLFSWAEAQITLTNLDTDEEFTDCLKNFTFTLPLALDTDDYCLNRDLYKHRPTRSGLPDPTLSMNWKYQDPRAYDAYVAGTPFSVSASFLGDEPIEDDVFPSFTIDVPAFIYHEANDPEVSVDEPTMQTMPAKILSNGTDPVVSFTQVTSDSTY